MALLHVSPGEKVSLTASSGSDSEQRTHALVKTNRFEAVRLAVAAGSTIAPHSVPGYITLHCLDGEVTLQAEQATQMTVGDWLYLEPGERHALSASKDSVLLLTILFEG